MPTDYRRHPTIPIALVAVVAVVLELLQVDVSWRWPLSAVAVGSGAVAIACLFAASSAAARRGPSDVTEVVVALQRGRASLGRRWGWAARLEHTLANELKESPRRELLLGDVQEPRELASKIADFRPASLAVSSDSAGGMTPQEREATFAFYEGKARDLVAWVTARTDRAAADSARRWTLLAALLSTLALCAAVVPSFAGSDSLEQGPAGPDGGSWRVKDLQTFVTVAVERDTASARSARVWCPGLQDGDMHFGAFLLTSDDRDGLQDGPFSVLAADPACSGVPIVVKSGEGHYRPALADVADAATDTSGGDAPIAPIAPSSVASVAVTSATTSPSAGTESAAASPTPTPTATSAG